MSLYRQFVKHVLNPLDLWRSGDYAEIRYLKEYERTQFLPPDELHELVWTRLRHILDRAYRHIPYYKESFDRAGVVPSDIRTEADMLAVPLLEKRQLQEHFETLLDPDWPKNDLILDKTGGSTGTPVNYYYSRARKWSRQAAMLRHDRWTGYEVGDPRAALWGAARDMPPPGWKQKLKALIFPKELLINAAEMTPENMRRFNEQLKRRRPPVILAYASAAAVFAVFLKQNKIVPYQPKAIITSAEVLLPEYRKVINEVFEASVFNRFGTREFSVIASECDRHEGMHVMAEGLYVEILKDGRPAGPGEIGEVVVTDLLNEPMPLIRYCLKDTTSRVAGICSCGRHLPRIADVAGRVTDFLVGMDGRFCVGPSLALPIVGQRPSLGQVQILQDEYGKLLYRIGGGKNRTLSRDDIDFIRRQTELYLGKGMQVDFEYVDSIPHEPSGKYIFSRSKIAQEMFQ